jgi:NAD+ synthase
LTKSEVYKLARALGVPERIIKKPPSAGLWPGQTDEGEMGVKYKELDRLIIALERGRSLSGFKKDVVEKVLKRSKQVSHKLKPPKIFKVKLA